MALDQTKLKTDVCPAFRWEDLGIELYDIERDER